MRRLLLSLIILAAAGISYAQSVGPGGVPGAGSSGGVTSINSTTGAFIFTGNGVSCTTTTCTFTQGSAGVSSLTGDGTVFNNNASTGAVTLTFATPAANTVFGNFTAGAAAPTFSSTPTFSAANLTNFPSTLDAWASITSGANTQTGAFSTAAPWTFSVAGAASTPGLHITGAPASGSATTSYPQLYLDYGASQPTTFSTGTGGTPIGINAVASFTGDYENFFVNGTTNYRLTQTSSTISENFAAARAQGGYDGTNYLLQGGTGHGIGLAFNNATFGSGYGALLDSSGNFGVGTQTSAATSDPFYVAATGLAIHTGIPGTSTGTLVLGSSTATGSITLTPAAAASAFTVTVPAATDTLANLAGTQSLSNKTIAALALTGTTTGFSGVVNGNTYPASAAFVSGGIPYFSSTSAMASSALLTHYGVVYGGGAGATPVATAASTTTTQALFATATAPAFRSLTPADTASEETVASSTTPTFLATIRMSYNVLTANVTSFTLASGTDGQQKVLVFCQNATGSFTVTPPANVHGFFTVGATASKCSTQTFSYSASQTAWLAESSGVVNQ